MKQINVRLSEKMIKELKVHSALSELSIQDIVKESLEDYFERVELRKYVSIKEGDWKFR